MDGFVDATALVKGGVYILLLRGKVVFVGKATSAMLPRIAAHRSLARKSTPAWLPIRGITFDQVFIKAVHPDRLEAEYLELVLEHNPIYNLPSPAFTKPEIQITRRV